MINSKLGFTIIEVIVAVAILGIALAAFIPLTVSSMRLFTIAKQRHVAEKIAQEGIEFMINKKENNIICLKKPGCLILDWQQNLVSPPQGYEIDASDTDDLLAHPSKKFGPYNDKFICLNNGKYDQCTGPQPPVSGGFKRKILSEKINDNSIKVQSIVTWGSQSLSIATLLFNS